MQPSLFSQQVKAAGIPVSAPQLRELGVTRAMTAGPKWRRASYGHYVHVERKSTAAQWIVDQCPKLPDGGAIAGWAAAFIHGVDWLDGTDPHTGKPWPVPLCVGARIHRRTTASVRYVRDRLPAEDVVWRHGLPVTHPLRTAFDTARWAPSLDEAVVYLDAMAHFRLVEPAALAAYLAVRPRCIGLRQAREALSLTSPAVRSPWESRIRMVYMLEAGLPQPLVNPSIFDRRGRLLGIADLLDEEAGLVLEYDGGGHRERRQHNADNEREEALESAGLVVVRADSFDYRDKRAKLVERMIDGRRRGMLRNRRLDRWTLATPDWALNPYDLLSDEDKDAMFGAA